ncbi:nodulation protein S (NodS) [Antricoccus suffuscus]|uniref:Nodulation protein S (NodS) n=1 Tax=Antricoccus suffuscus TaxID=1629062 RepID=A0A2T1A1Q0_9ACTN|nr:class I SAM-dependent methyltransferase [Antricoccus suffuscus]PRZ42258.1 nodulation protein S (NodS) [Antricoccus suffuscus]
MDPEYFDRIYSTSSDPWGFTTRWYERRKVALTMAILPQERFGSCFEPGCSIGVLTAELAQRCDRVVATDIADAALARAQSRLSATGIGNVEMRHWALGASWPDEMYDLVVLSEVGYYLEPGSARRAIDCAAQHLHPDGALLAAHWRHPVAEYPSTGDDFHALLNSTRGMERASRYIDEDVVIDLLRPSGTRSVAEQEGLVTPADQVL